MPPFTRGPPVPAETPEFPHPREILKAHGIWAERGLGQNFLVASRDLDRVVETAGVEPDEAALEIGTGMGRLTARLAAAARRVVSVEIDEELHAVAEDHLAGFDNAVLLRCDFLESKHRINPAVTRAVERELQNAAKPLKVVSNLPYGISSPALANLLEWRVPVGEMYLMLQKEVAERVTAGPGEAQYGTLSVFVAYWGRAQRMFTVAAGAFWPPPRVESALVRIVRTRRRRPEYVVFSAVVRRLFQHRRKTLRRTLRDAWDRETAEAVLGKLGRPPDVRVGKLSPKELETAAEVIGRPPEG